MAIPKRRKSSLPKTVSSPDRSFKIAIKVDSLEARRRMQHHFSHDLPSRRGIFAMIVSVDPDGLLWTALEGLQMDLTKGHEELQIRYIPEREYLARSVLQMEALFARIRTLMKKLTAGLDKGYQEVPAGLSLRAAAMVGEIESARDGLEEMRTCLGKELVGLEGVCEKGRFRLSRGWFRRDKQEQWARMVQELHQYAHRMLPWEEVGAGISGSFYL